MSTNILLVVKKYRGRGISEQFLKSNEANCNECRIKLTVAIFISDVSNSIADNDLELPSVKSDAFTHKAIVF